MPHASTRTSASPGPGSGTRHLLHPVVAGPWQTTACIVAGSRRPPQARSPRRATPVGTAASATAAATASTTSRLKTLGMM
jgi:hypothetical protein